MHLPGWVGVFGALLLAGLSTGCVSGRPPGATLGVSGRTVIDEETGARDGVVVVHVHERSPLKDQGVRKGDVIVSVNGDSPGRAADLAKRIFEGGWKKRIKLEVRRGDEVREIEVLPAPAYRTFRIGLGIPFLWHTHGDEVEVVPFSLFTVGTGPDQKGFLLLGCVGFMSGPESNAVWLGVFHTGTGIGPPEPRPRKKDPMEDEEISF